MYLFEDTRDIMLRKLKEDTHPQVQAQLQGGLLKCKCGFTPKDSSPFENGNFHLKMELEGKAFFLGIFH